MSHSAIVTDEITLGVAMIRNDVAPILASLRKHKLTAFLLALQAMFVCAIICNILNLVTQRIALVSVPSGVSEERISVVETNSAVTDANWVAVHADALRSLRKLPGVSAVAAIDSLPLSGGESTFAVCSTVESFTRAMKSHTFAGPGCMQPAVLSGTQGELSTLGLKLVSGRDFLPEEYVLQDVPSAIISRSLAEHLFPGKEPLGQTFYAGSNTDHPIRVIGVVDHLVRPNPRDMASSEFTMLWPMLPNESDVTYVIRSAPADRDHVLHQAVSTLQAIDLNLVIPSEKTQTFAGMRSNYYRRDLAMIDLLLMAIATLLFVTAAGIAGLAKFWVQQRTRYVGIRRALGATRRDILTYFLTENLLIVGTGISAGIPLAYALNALLRRAYDVSHLSGLILPTCVLVLLLLGQLAAFGPALRASTASPIDSVRCRG